MEPSFLASTSGSRTSATSPYLDVNHRRDIDGLRALAALSVIAVHTGIIPGGGTGVDIFFVLSGFLISGIILRGSIRDQFSFSDFYARRIRRIFPALVVVLLTVWAVGNVVLLPDDYHRLGKDILTSATFSLYIFLGLETHLPFDPDVGGDMLTHLWSLGVEEQFYLVWPLLLVCVYRFARSRLSYLAVGVAGTALVAFALFVVEDRLPPSLALAPWRGLYELSLGGLLAVLQLGDFPLLRKIVTSVKNVPTLGRWALNANLWTLIATMFLIYALLHDPARQLFHNSWSIAPTLGTLLLLLSGSQSTIGRRMFASRGMVFFGLISYPLYLWHYPVLVFTTVLTWGHLPSPLDTLLLVLSISTALAFLTYKYIEIPIRQSPRRASTIVSLCTAISLTGLLGLATLAGLIRPVSYLTGGDLALTTSEDWLSASNSTSWTQFQDQPLVLGSGRPRALFIGDSNMQQYYPRIRALLLDHKSLHQAVAFITRFGCVPGAETVSDSSGCGKYIHDAVAYASESHVDTVVISACWYGYFSDMQWIRGFGKRNPLKPSAEPAMENLKRIMNGFVGSGKHVYLVLNIPVGFGLDPRARAYWHGAPPVSLSKREVTAVLEPVDSQLRRVAAEVGATVIDPLDYLCNPLHCPVVSNDGKSLYRDLWHLRPSYVRNDVTFLDEVVLEH